MRWSTRLALSLLAAVLSPMVALAVLGVPSVPQHLGASREVVIQGSVLWIGIIAVVLLIGSVAFAATWTLSGRARGRSAEVEARLRAPRGGSDALGEMARAFDELSSSLERSRREAAQKQRELDALNAVALAVNRTVDLLSSVEETLEVVQRVAGMDVAALYRLDEGRETLSLVAQRGLTLERSEQFRHRPVDGSELGKAIQTGRAGVVHGLSSLAGLDATLHALAEERNHQTQLTLPIPVKGETWGVMVLVASETREFPSEEMQLMEAVAYQVGAAVERATLLSETREKGRKLEHLVGLARTVTSSLDLGDVLRAVIEAASSLVPASRVQLWIAEEDKLLLHVDGKGAEATLEKKRIFAIGEGLVGHVAESRQPLAIERATEDPRTENLEWLQRHGYVSFAGVPLLLQNRLLGVLEILTRRPHRFTREEMELLVSVATQVAISIDNSRLYTEAARRAAEHQAMLEVASHIGSTLKVERVLDVIVERAHALLGVRAAGIFKLDEARGLLAYERGSGLSPEFVGLLRVRVGEGTSGKALQYRAPAWSPDLLNEPTLALSEETRALVRREGYRAALSIPILIKGNPYGVLAVYWWEEHSPTFSEIRLLSALAGQTAVALENAQLYEAAARRVARMRSLAEMGRILVSTFDMDQILDTVATRCRQALEITDVGVFVLDENTAELRYLLCSGFSEDFGRTHRLRVGEGVAGRAVAENRTIWSTDILNDVAVMFRPETRARIASVGSRAALAIPLGRERPFGVLVVNREPGYRFMDEEVEFLSTFASQVAVALENARLFALEQRRRAQVEALVEIERELTAELNPDRLLDLIIERAGALLKGGGIVFLYDETARTLVPESWYAVPAQVRHLWIPLGAGLVGMAAAERRGLLANDFGSTPYAASQLQHGIPRLPTAHEMAQPLISHNRLLGVVTVSRGEGDARFTVEDLETFRSFATQAAIALENARLYREAREYGERLRALHEVNRLVSSSLQVEEVVRNIAQATSAFFEAPQAYVWVVEPGGQRLRRSVTVGDPEIAAGLSADMALGEGGVGWVARERTPILWTDLEQDRRILRRTWALRHGLRYFTAYPIMLGDRLLGAIAMFRRAPYPTTPETEALLGSLVAQAAVALDNARLYAETAQRLQETRTLLAVGQELSLNLPTQESMRRVAREVARAFGADMVGAYFLDAAKEALVPMAGYHVPKELLSKFLETPFPLSRFSILREALRTGRPVWTPDAMNDPRFDAQVLAGIRPGAVLLAPTPVRGEIVGGLFLVWWTPGRTFAPAELRLVEGIAAQVGLALENADLARQTQEKLRETEALLSVSRAVSSTLDLQPLLRHFLRQVARTIECDSVGVWLTEPTTGWLEPVAGYRIPPHLLAALREIRIDPTESPFYAEGFRSKSVQVSTNVPEDPRIPELLKAAGPHRAQLFAPIVAKDRVAGAFIAVWWERTPEFSERELALIEAMGNQAAVALENASLFEDNRRRVKELSALHELSRAVTGQLDMAELVRAVHRQVARVLDARNMVILFHDAASGEVELAFRMVEGREAPASTRCVIGKGLGSRVLERRRPIRTENYLAECRREGVEPVEDSLPYPYWLGVPMVTGNQTIGALVLRSNAHAFTAGDERLLVNIAGLAALAVRSARLFDERSRAYDELATAQDQLIRTEKLRALGEMASGVAHDFNNLLSSILGRTQLLLRRVEDPKLRQWLQVIERSATDGARTVRRVQEFARIRRDQPLVVVDLNSVVQEALEVTQSRWQREAQSQGITIEVTTGLGSVPPIAGDPAELREVLTNLILNAVDAMPGGGNLTITTLHDGSSVVLNVHDTGVGIASDVRSRIFDPFFTTKGSKGTGLGLSITYGIVARHQGQISVQSAEGQGTTFCLMFPAGPAEREPQPSVSLQAVSPMRCLVVDDEQPVLEVLGDLLATGGHSAVLLSDGAEAITRFKAEVFDIVLTDLAMPGVNGWQVARAVKDHAPAVPVLLITGWGVELSPEALRGHGVAAVLSKPVKLDDILTAVAIFGSRDPGEPQVQGEDQP